MRLSAVLLLCLLAGRSEGQAEGEGNEIRANHLTHEDRADTKVEDSGGSAKNAPALDQQCKPPIYSVLTELGALRERLSATVTALEETNKKLEASEKNLFALNKTVTELGEVDRGQSTVAFSVALPIDGTIGPANVLHSLVYRRVLSNVGGHYNQHTGYFTAPLRGVFYFTFTSFCWPSTVECGGSLYHNGNRRVSWYGHTPNHPVSGSNSAILSLQVGDNVNVRLWRNSRISDNGNLYSTFSGFLISQL